MIINNNISALNTYRQLGVNNNANAKSLEKLSSGLRINKAGDDAAGLAISEKMRAQIRGLDQASRNAQDGVSMIQTAEGALQETQNILQRMRELATQAANDSNVGVDRNEIQKEINQLTSEVNRIGNTTEFNTQNLLDGGAKDLKVTEVTPAVEGMPATSGKLVGENSIVNTTGFSGLTGTDNAITISVAGTDFEISDTQLKTIGNDFTNQDITSLFENADDGSGNKLSDVATISVEGGKLTIEANSTGTTSTVGLSIAGADAVAITAALGTGIPVITPGEDADNTGAVNGVYSFELGDIREGSTVKIGEETFTFGNGEIAIGANKSETLVNLINEISVSSTAYTATLENGKILLEQRDATANAQPSITQTNAPEVGYSATFQIGANKGQSMTIEIQDMRAEALGISGAAAGIHTAGINAKAVAVNGATFAVTQGVSNGTDNEEISSALDVSTHEKATAAIEVFNNAIEAVSAERSKIGAYQNRLEHTVSNLGTSSENLQAAESRIRDVDMAKEVMEMTKKNILSQASQAMLAQANQKPQAVLQLLG